MTTMTHQQDLAFQALAEILGPKIEQFKARQWGLKGDGLAYGEKHDVASVSPSGVGYMHGPGGLLTWPGVDPDIFNAAVGADSIIGQLPTNPSLYMNPTFDVLTGVTADTGSEPDAVCDPPIQAGLMKICMLTSVFGRYERATRELEINRLGQRVDRADPLDLRMVGSPIANAGMWAGPGGLGLGENQMINEVANAFWERNISFYRLLSQQIWQGNPANNSNGGGYRELTGLELLVATGHADAITGVACPASDSIIYSFNYQRIDSNGAALVAALSAMYYEAKDRGRRTGLTPVRWVFAMRPQLFWEISAIWACSYLTFRCNLGTNGQNVYVDATEQVRFRDEMRAGRYLMLDGDRIEVLLDDGISELNGNDSGGNFPAGCFATDIFLLPMSVQGGRSVLYMEYYQYSNPSIMSALGNMVLGTIEGAFITWPEQTRLCVQWGSKVEPRLIMRTPWLAGRLQNVVYCPVQHSRSAFPENPYFVNGGQTSRSGPSYFNLW